MHRSQPSAGVVSNDSKVYQAAMSAAFGFSSPRTLVTTEPDAVREFFAACSGRVIYKALVACGRSRTGFNLAI